MPNSRRFNLPEIPQHVVQRGNNRSPCFVEEADYREYLGRLAAASSKFDVAIHAYVLMSNHVHLLLSPRQADGAGKLMQAVGSGYVRSFNTRHGRTGTLWEGRYFSSLVGGDSYLWNCYRYIELNPVRARLTRQPHEYPWSSHACNAWGVEDAVVEPHPAYVALSENAHRRQLSYREMFEVGLPDAAVEEIRFQVRHELAIGDEAFLASIDSASNRSPRFRPRGRPRICKAQE